MKRSNSALHLISVFLLFTIIGGILLFNLLKKPIDLWAPKISDHQSSVSALWAKQGVYINQDDQAQLISIGDNLILIGSDTPNKPSHLIALDKNTGNIIWQYGTTDENVLAA